jgi:uncharacterized membrane protein YkgB
MAAVPDASGSEKETIAMASTHVQPRTAAHNPGSYARIFELVGGGILRYGLVFLLVAIGLLKFTEAEALAIQPWVPHSPFLGWLYAVTTVQGASRLIGIVEITLGILLAVNRWFPRLAAIAGLGTSAVFVITVTFLFTTPDLSPDTQGFLFKDFMLFGAAVWATGQSLLAAQARAATGRR